MKPSAEDKAEGKYHEVKGAVRETAGKLTNNPDWEVEGRDEKNAGKAQKKIGQVEKAIEKWRDRLVALQF
ncbi:MAG: CsbD family protein [Terriglobia bacterium]